MQIALRALSAYLLLPAAMSLAHVRVARAEGFVFDIEDATIIPGSGQAVLDSTFPSALVAGQGPEFERQLAPVLQSLVAQLKGEVLDRLAPPKYNFSPFLKATANASALSAKAAPVDHATAFRIFSLSLGAGAAVGGLDDIGALKQPGTIDNRIQNGDVPRFGVAPEISALLGIHLGKFNLPSFRFFDLNRLELYLNVFKVRLHGDSWQVAASSYGGHAKYQIMLGKTLANHGLVRWHGLNVITGLNYSGQSVSIKTTLPEATQSQTISFQGQPMTVTGTFVGTAHLGVRMKSFTIPIEVASSIELLHAITFFGGLGLDFNIGRAQLTANATAPVDVRVAGPGGGAGTLVSEPQPRLDYDMLRRPMPVDLRGFAGLQLGYAAAALFAQVAADTTKTVAAHGGLRLFW